MLKKKKNHIRLCLSVTLTLLLAFSLSAGLFSPKAQIAKVRAATALTNVSNTLTSTKASAITTHQINFTTYTSLPNDGKIVITFPDSFDVSDVDFNSFSGIDGGQSVATSSQIITITRDGAGTASVAGSKYIKLDTITNQSATGTSYTVTVETQDSSGTTLDGPTNSFYFSVCENDCLSSLYQIPWVSTVSTTTNYTTKFTTASTTPSGAKIKITFPDGFDISSASTTELNGSDSSYDLTQSINGQTITITNASSSDIAAGSLYVVMSGVINQATASSTYYATLETITEDDINIEGPATIRFSVSSEGLGLANSAWPVKNFDRKHTGNSPYGGSSDYYTIEWVYTDSESLNPAGTVVFNTDNDLAYINSQIGGGNASPPNRDRLLAINTIDGTLNWNYAFNDVSGISTPSVAIDGTIYFQTGYGDGHLYAFDTDGTVKWVYNTYGNRKWWGIWPSPMIDKDGTIYIGGESNDIFYSINPDGTLKWAAAASGNYVWDTASIDDNNIIYVYGNGGAIRAFYRDGTVKWNSTDSAASSYPAHGPTIGADGKILFSKDNSTFIAVNPEDGSTAWSYSSMENRVNADPAIDSQGNIYVKNKDNSAMLHKLDSDGNLIWKSDIATYGGYFNDVILGGDGSIIYHTSGNALLAHSVVDGSLKWKYISGGSGVSIDSNGDLYSGYRKLKPWTLTSSVDSSTGYLSGKTITFTAVSSMLSTDPVTSEANQVQVYLEDGTTVPLSYSSTDSDGNTVWTGTWTVPEKTLASSPGTHTATIEASSVNVETDTAIHLASAPTNSNNTGITSTVTYKINSRAAVIMTPQINSPSPEPERILATSTVENIVKNKKTEAEGKITAMAISNIKAQITLVRSQLVAVISQLIQLVQEQIIELQSQLSQVGV